MSPHVSTHPTRAASTGESVSASRSPSGEYARMSATGGGMKGRGFLSPEMAMAGGWSDDGRDDEDEGDDAGQIASVSKDV